MFNTHQWEWAHPTALHHDNKARMVKCISVFAFQFHSHSMYLRKKYQYVLYGKPTKINKLITYWWTPYHPNNLYTKRNLGKKIMGLIIKGIDVTELFELCLYQFTTIGWQLRQQGWQTWPQQWTVCSHYPCWCNKYNHTEKSVKH